MAREPLEKLLVLALLDLAETRAEIAALHALLLETSPQNPDLLNRVSAERTRAYTAALDLLTMTLRTEGLLEPLAWATRQRFPQQAG